MAACSARSCIVVVATDVDQQSFEVEFDDVFWNQQLPILEEFFYFILYEISDPNKSRNLSIRKYEDVRAVTTSEKWQTWPELNANPPAAQPNDDVDDDD